LLTLAWTDAKKQNNEGELSLWGSSQIRRSILFVEKRKKIAAIDLVDVRVGERC
jgi:hypothetical protein